MVGLVDYADDSAGRSGSGWRRSLAISWSGSGRAKVSRIFQPCFRAVRMKGRGTARAWLGGSRVTPAIQCQVFSSMRFHGTTSLVPRWWEEVAPVNEPPVDGHPRLFQRISEGTHAGEEPRHDGAAGLRLGKDEPRSPIDDEVDFGARRAIMPQAGLYGAMRDRLEDLHRHPALEDLSPQRVVTKFLRRTDAQEVAGQPRIQKVELGRLDLALPDVAAVGGSAKYEEAGLHDRQPSPDRIVPDTGIGRQRRQIHLRRSASRRQPQEGGERVEVRDVPQGPYIAFHVRRRVVAQPGIGRDPTVVDPRIRARPQRLQQIRRRPAEAPELIEPEREQMENADPTRERLAHGIGQSEVLRSRQHEPAGRGVLVHLGLQVGGKVRCPLYFVDHRAAPVLPEEPAGIFPGVCAQVKTLKRDVGPVRKHGATQGGLAGLPGAGEGDHRIVAQSLAQLHTEVAINDGHGRVSAALSRARALERYDPIQHDQMCAYCQSE